MRHDDSYGHIDLYLPEKKCYSTIVHAIILGRDIKPDLVQIIKTDSKSRLYLSTKDLEINDVDFILEYLEERFPYPPLYPSSPILITQTRLEQMRINEYINLLDQNKLTSEILEEISLHIIELLKHGEPYLLGGDNFQMLDCIVGCFYRHCIGKHISIRINDISFSQYLKQVLNRPVIKLAYDIS